jgi:DNA segregation ATPase FtsK/SpoIIIE, S-DNA-T family
MNRQRSKSGQAGSELSELLVHSEPTGSQKARQMVRASTAPPKPLAIRYRFLEGLSITCIAIAVFLGLSMLSYQPAKNATQLVIYAANNIGGELGYYIARWLFLQIGMMAYVLPATLTYVGILSFKNRSLNWQVDYMLALCQLLGFMCVIVAGCGFNSSWNFHHGLPYPGGLIGFYIDTYLSRFFGDIGIRLLLTVLLLTGITLATGISWVNVIEQLIKWILATLWRLQKTCMRVVVGTSRWIIRLLKRAFGLIKDAPSKAPERKAQDSHDNTEASSLDHFIGFESARNKSTKPIQEAMITPVQTVQHLELDGPIPIKRSAASENLPPPLDLLDLPDKNQNEAYTPEELEALSREVELRLKDFGIQVEVVGAYPGPVVTRFEMKLAPGIKASRITTLATDLARSLAVISVRIVEIIPGKPVVGLELPNRNRAMVRLREILDSSVYQEPPSPLLMALGKDISGEPVVVDLSKMPHLLVAGTTGSGKSVGLNAMLLSILYKATPDQVRLIMIDPKMLELSIYEGIPHLLSPVVTDMKKAANALRWCITEMDRRYKLMSLLGVRNLAGYNQKVEAAMATGKPLINPMPQKRLTESTSPELLGTLPYIVVLADEFADLIMVVGKKVEELIVRLAQKARAAGIHLILATQRPSVDVITGLIKANIPTRIAFQVSSSIDSRTILGQPGAEQLLGHGDMLYMAPGTGVPSRVHGAFIADEEVHKVVEALKKTGPSDYQIVFSETGEESSERVEDAEAAEDDQSLYEQAIKVVMETRRPSISNVQRRLKIGYNRAAGLLEQMEQEGIVSGMSNSGRREVLLPEED